MIELEKKIDVGVQNKERIISDILKQEKYRKLEKIRKNNDTTIQLFFSEKYPFRIKKRVVQFSKKKYKNREEIVSIIKIQKDSKTIKEVLWKDIQVVELPTVWLVFCQRS